MTWIETFDAVFFISIATLLAGLMKYSFDKCFQSKCEHFDFCFGLFSVQRRVDLEVQTELKALEHSNQASDSDAVAKGIGIESPKSKFVERV